jgi:outer membrane protein assembly factor BamB
LPAWGAPVVEGGRVFVGLGNGRLTEPAREPAGGLACLDAQTGAVQWTFPVADAVFGRPAIAGERVVFGSRDGNLYGLTFGGKEAFRVPMGGPVMAPPVADGGRVYAVAVPGRIICVDGADGRELWRYELSQRGAEPKVYSAPRIMGRRLYVAGELMAGQAGVICLHCFELPENAQP